MFLFSLRFTEIYWVVYLRGKGLSFAAIGLLETVFHIASFSAEIPTGIIADRFGRRISLVVGRLLAAVSAALILFAKDWRLFAVSFAINAVSYTCHSGAFDALVYDSLPSEKRCDFSKILGRLNSTYLFGTAIAGGIAALVATWSLDWLYEAVVVVDLVAALACFGMPRDERRRDVIASVVTSTGDGPLSAATDGDSQAAPCPHSIPGPEESRSDLKTLIASLRSPELRNLLLLWGISGALGTSVSFYGQSILEEALLPIALIGLSGTAKNLLAIGPASSAYRVQRRFGSVRPVVWGSYILSAVAIGMSAAAGRHGRLPMAILVALYMSICVVQEAMYPLFSDAVNARTGSLNRAAVLSSGGMVFSVAMMITFPLVGHLGDLYGLRWGVVAGALLTALCITPVAKALISERK